MFKFPVADGLAFKKYRRGIRSGLCLLAEKGNDGLLEVYFLSEIIKAVKLFKAVSLHKRNLRYGAVLQKAAAHGVKGIGKTLHEGLRV